MICSNLTGGWVDLPCIEKPETWFVNNQDDRSIRNWPLADFRSVLPRQIPFLRKLKVTTILNQFTKQDEINSKLHINGLHLRM